MSVCVCLAARRVVVGSSQLHHHDSLHLEHRQSQADDEHAQREKSQHPVWGVPRLQGLTRLTYLFTWLQQLSHHLLAAAFIGTLTVSKQVCCLQHQSCHVSDYVEGRLSTLYHFVLSMTAVHIDLYASKPLLTNASVFCQKLYWKRLQW